MVPRAELSGRGAVKAGKMHSLGILLLLAASPQSPTANPHLAKTPWPIFHGNMWAQGTTPLRGPEPQDRLDVQFVKTRGASSWIQFGPSYADGSRPLWGGTMNSVFKLVARGDRFVKADEIELPGKSISDCFILSDGRYVTCDRDRRRILVFEDAEPGNPMSRIRIAKEFPLPASTPGKFAHMTLSYDGWIVWMTNDNYLGATPLDFSRHVSYRLRVEPGEVASHNSFPIDGEGNLFIVSSGRMLSLNFRNGRFSPRWEVPYDFTGTGGRYGGRRREMIRTVTGAGGTGSGTTPTLLGEVGQPRMVAVVDGREPNNMVLFYADDVPPGRNRLAARTPLPHSTPAGRGFTAENSPVGIGNQLFTAQYNGFIPERNPVPGAQKLEWDPASQTLRVVWANPDAVMNGVPTLSLASGLVYSSGPVRRRNQFVALDWATGKTKISMPLPFGLDSIDQGNQVIIDTDRSLYFSGKGGVVRIRPSRP